MVRKSLFDYLHRAAVLALVGVTVRLFDSL